LEQRRPFRRQPQIRLAPDACHYSWRISAGDGDCHEGPVLVPPGVSDSLKASWQRHVIAASGYLELGMFDAAAQVLEEIEPEDKTRKEVLAARVDLYMAAKK
jgi:hypothetical protein